MQTCGEFEVVREFASGSDASLYTTRAEGRRDAAGLAIKIWRFTDATPYALQAAAEQRAAVAAGCARFAPIYSIGQTDEGCAYYVTSRYSLSVRGVIKAGNKVSAKFLERLCTDVLRGLAELYEKRGRSHGNLRPGNILLDSGDPVTLRAFLTDLAPEPEGATIADDLYELGCIVYQVVRHVTRRPNLNPPVEFGPEWESLGEEADGWLAFCNLLLDRAGNSEPDAIHTLLQKLRRIGTLGRTATDGGEEGKPRRARKRRSGTRTILVWAFLLTTLGGGYFLWKKDQRRQTHHAGEVIPYERLLALMEEARDEPTLREKFEKFAADEAKPTTMEEFRNAVRQWSIAYQLESATQRFEKRGWTLLQHVVARAGNFDPTVEFGAQIKNAKQVAEECNVIEVRWDPVEKAAQMLRDKAGGDDSIIRLAEWPQLHLAEAGDFVVANQFIAHDKKLLSEVATYMAGTWIQRVDQARFRWESKVSKSQKVNLAEWLAEAQAFEKGSDARLPLLRKRLGAVRLGYGEAIAKGSQDPTLSEVREALERLEKVTPEALSVEIPQIDQSLTALEKEIKRIGTITEHPAPRPATIADNTADVSKPPASKQTVAPEYAKFTEALRVFQAFVKDAQSLQEAQKERENFKESIASKYRDDPAVAPWLASLAIIGAQSSLTLPTLTDPKVGWVSTGEGGADWAVYRKEGIEVPFHRIELQPGGEVYALSAIEIPWRIALRARGPTYAPGEGPRVWQVGDGRVLNFIWPAAEEGLLAIKRQYWNKPDPPQLLAPGLTVKPTEDAPVNFISFADARAMASALGGDLPTRDLWLKGYQKAVEKKWGDKPRLRGTAWSTQIAHLTGLEKQLVNGAKSLDIGKGKKFLWPDLGSYDAVSGDDRASDEAKGGDDLWFSGATRESKGHPEGIYDLVGNVAEYVYDKGQAFVVGGSAISSPKLIATLVTERVRAIAPHGYSDVGFRLAVRVESAGGDQLALFKARVSGFLPPLPPPIP